MSLDLDDKADMTGARTVTLAGRDFTILPLSLRQVLAIADLTPKLGGFSTDAISSERLVPLAEIVFCGLRRAYPSMTHDEFFDMPIKVLDLVAALPVVIEQAGGRMVNDAGEAVAASGLTSKAGESSSPNS